MYRYASHECFDSRLPFFKGNLHCHSTSSDGRFSQAELIALYQSAGYHFLCFSDHNVYTDFRNLDSGRFITLPGVEWSCDRMDGNVWRQTHHMHGIAGTAGMLQSASAAPLTHGQQLPQFPFRGQETVQEMRRFMAARGCITMYNHPAWSCTNPEDFGMLADYTALEIYNYSCDLENHTAYADCYWDWLLSRGARIWGVATDDNHNKITPSDSFGGWICVNSPDLTHDHIVQGILDGRFYSSHGPVVRNYGIRDGKAFVDCDPVHHVNFIAGGAVALGRSVWSEKNEDDLTHAEYRLSGYESYIRMECVDHNGATAWTNPIFPDASAEA